MKPAVVHHLRLNRSRHVLIVVESKQEDGPHPIFQIDKPNPNQLKQTINFKFWNQKFCDEFFDILKTNA